MRYIPKPSYSSALTLLEDARKKMQEAGISELYEHFYEKEQLNSILREEQKQICCYCQRRIDHFQGENECHAQTFNLIIIIYSHVAICPKDSRSIVSIAENIKAVMLSIEIFLLYATVLIILNTMQMVKSCHNAQ